MARRKTLPESLRAKLELAERLAALRLELFGERGGPELARRLSIPVRTWYNYEGGVTIPAEVVLRIIELTSVEPVWLLHGNGSKFRQPSSLDHHEPSNDSRPPMSVGALLRTALQLLETEGHAGDRNGFSEVTVDPHVNGPARMLNQAHGPEPSDGLNHPGIAAASPNPSMNVNNARGEWLEAQQENRCIHVHGNSMSPVVANGASVAYSREEESPEQLDGKMVVVWLEEAPTVRWFQDCGRYALLRAENSGTVPPQTLIDLENPADHPRIRRVLWIDTPH